MDNSAKIWELLGPYIAQASLLSGGANVVTRTSKLMDAVGNPETKIKVIHIAGTSGKSSTAYYISSMLDKAGLTVGLTVSPHVDRIEERVQLNGSPIGERLFYDFLKEFIDLISREAFKPSYFELLYAFAIWVFAKLEVDYAVVETGVGGLYDATNVIKSEDKLCVITDLGMDHMALLGDSIEQIAAHKAGIIHEGNVAITFQKEDSVMNVIRDRITRKRGSRLIIVDPEEVVRTTFIDGLPSFQRRNWTLALNAYKYLALRDGLKQLSIEQELDTQQIYIPGRMDIRKVGNKTLVMDGAHNNQKLESLSVAVRELFPNQRATTLIALKNSKDMSELSNILAPISDQVILTTFDSSKDLPAKAALPADLAEILKFPKDIKVCVIDNHQEAFRFALSSVSPIVIVTGSFYLLSQIRKEMTNKIYT